MKLGYSAPRTPRGRIYRLSPNAHAHPQHFLLGDVVADIQLTDPLRVRMKHSPRTKSTVCPYSGIVAEDDAYVHPEDVNASVEMVKHDFVQDAHDAIAEMLQDAFSSSSSSNSLIKITTSSKPKGLQPKPRFFRNDLMRELVCDHCGRDYGVFAIGLFCPDCGAPNLRLHFLRETELVGAQVGLAEEMDESQEELAFRLMGNAHEDVLTAFEATLKTVYLYGKNATNTIPSPKVGNDFQNVDRATKRFAELGLNPFENLSDFELDALRLNIQKRHIVGHNLGVVDDKFAAIATDAKVGETVNLVGVDIRQFACISQKVVDSLDSWLGGSPSPTIAQSPLLPMIEKRPDPDDPLGLMSLDLKLSLLARKIAFWTAKQCAEGRFDHIDPDALMSAFAQHSKGEIEEAIAELETDGFVEVLHVWGGEISQFQPLLELYLTFDGPAFGRDPIADAVTLAELALAHKETASADDIFPETGWDVRRFNPAFEYVATHIPENRVSRHYGTQFGVTHLYLMPEDRVQLKRMISRMKR